MGVHGLLGNTEKEWRVKLGRRGPSCSVPCLYEHPLSKRMLVTTSLGKRTLSLLVVCDLWVRPVGDIRCHLIC